ncbi:hypothetical protein JTE90_003512 [Oedothorax gibbosus]|uniref:Uncharacterized protein n=1 Tax=Oedothorax gibbosus TaxID=931172 RepID=A0AAV6TIB0_9ARAC|nr:hypothetical protein JTE90_003512 [Oedothorax gibbosus]
MVGYAPTMVVTVTGNQGSIPEREPEKRLPHPKEGSRRANYPLPETGGSDENKRLRDSFEGPRNWKSTL